MNEEISFMHSIGRLSVKGSRIYTDPFTHPYSPCDRWGIIFFLSIFLLTTAKYWVVGSYPYTIVKGSRETRRGLFSRPFVSRFFRPVYGYNFHTRLRVVHNSEGLARSPFDSQTQRNSQHTVTYSSNVWYMISVELPAVVENTVRKCYGSLAHTNTYAHRKHAISWYAGGRRRRSPRSLSEYGRFEGGKGRGARGK